MADKIYLDYPGLEEYDGLVKEWVKSFAGENAAARISALEDKVGDEKVEERVSAAVAKIVDSAPQTFDTLKEVADWIESHGEAATALMKTVSDLGDELEKTNARIDAIQAISSAEIKALFKNPVAYDSTKTVAEQVSALGDNDKLVIDSAENPTVAEDINLTSDGTIEAKGVTFTGTVTVPKDKDVTVIGATFTGQVKTV